ncbi:MAG: HNH endonuclease [Pseudobacter sp.]|uniref:HNH endonuclease n=1 Tax=Pseudobacter sp. TaxID=2045420 RepID=UPI003F81CE56
MDCYNCGTTLNRKTRSAEHILPNSIGGKRKAYNLLCKTCNEKFGRSIDNELASRLARFYTLLNTEAPAQKTNAAISSRKDGNIAQHDRFITAIKKDKSFSGSPGYFRAIAKICLNYYLSKGYPKQYCDTIKSFIRGEHTDPIYQYYAPENRPVHYPHENEVSHILHIHGSKTSGVLYAYIELFNMQNLVYIFSLNYNGEDLDVTYCRDIIKNEELTKNIQLDLSRKQLEQALASPSTAEERLFPRFERLMHIIENRITEAL